MMRRCMITVACITGLIILAQAGSVLAQPAGRLDRRVGPPLDGLPNPLLLIFDTDRDGTLSAAEIDAAATKLRERDVNKDGKLTADELPRAPGGRRGPGFGPGRGPGAIEG